MPLTFFKLALHRFQQATHMLSGVGQGASPINFYLERTEKRHAANHLRQAD